MECGICPGQVPHFVCTSFMLRYMKKGGTSVSPFWSIVVFGIPVV
jgi:hypothetical protein